MPMLHTTSKINQEYQQREKKKIVLVVGGGHVQVLRAECCHSDPEHLFMHLHRLGQLALVLEHEGDVVLNKRTRFFLQKSRI